MRHSRSVFCTVLFFTHDFYVGSESQFFLGSFDTDHAQLSGFTDDSVSSFIIVGDPGCLVTLYGRDNFQGWSASFGPGDWNCTAAIQGGFANDDTSSFRLELTAAPQRTTTTEGYTGPPTTATVTTTSRTTTTRTTITGTTITLTFTRTTGTVTLTTTTTSATSTLTSHTHTSHTHTSVSRTETTDTTATRTITRTSVTTVSTLTSSTLTLSTLTSLTGTATTGTRTGTTFSFTSHTHSTHTHSTVTGPTTTPTYSGTETTPLPGATTTTDPSATSTTQTAGAVLVNGGFESGSTTLTFQPTCDVPGWASTYSAVNSQPKCPVFVRSGRAVDAPFGGTNATAGNYYLALQRIGSAIEQNVSGHTPGVGYSLEFNMAKRMLLGDDPVLRVTIDGVDLGNFTARHQEMAFVSVDYVPSAQTVSIRLENVSPYEFGTVYLDEVQALLGPTMPGRCSELMHEGSVWGRAGIGIDVSRYTTGSLKWIGCNGNGCEPDSFYCHDTAGLGMEFGTTSTRALRAVLGNSFPISGEECATSSTPTNIVNAMDKLADVERLCQQLGYPSGQLVERGPSNSCPEVHWDDSLKWTSDFQNSQGYGMQFLCLEYTSTSTASNTTNIVSTTTTTHTHDHDAHQAASGLDGEDEDDHANETTLPPP